MDLNSSCVLWLHKHFWLVWIFKSLPSKHKETRIWHARPFTSTFYRPAYGLIWW